MFQKIIFLLAVAISSLLLSCKTHNKSREDKLSEARVKQIDGLYVFIQSDPIEPYAKIGELETGPFDKLRSLTHKSFLQVSAELFVSLSFDSFLKNTADEVKSAYPEADGMLFTENMSKCIIIKFN